MKNYSTTLLLTLLLCLGTQEMQAQTNTFPANGNVGVGTNTPQQKLHVHNPVGNAFALLSGMGPGVLFSSTPTYDLTVPAIGLTTTTNVHYHTTSNAGDLNIRSGAGKDVVLGTLSLGAGNGTERMRITNNGNIGIGTVVPTAKLHVNGSFRLANGTQQAGRVLTSDASGNATWQTVNAGNDNDWVVSGNDQYSGVSGNVGIGTTNPQQKLHIHNPDPAQNVFALLSGTGAGLLFSSTATNDLTVPAIGITTTTNVHYHTTSNAGDLNIRGGEGKDVVFGTLGIGNINGTERMRITNAGNVIVAKGIRSKNVKLGDTDHHIKLRPLDHNGGGGYRAAIAPSDVATSELLLNYNSEFTNGTRIMGSALMVDGKMAVGGAEVDQSYQLAVQGTIIAEELRIRTYNNGWPDYVFEDSYKLPTLEDLEAHIATQKHLPGIPSAATVAKEGFAVAEMQAKLLEKIEELTLHLIEMNKRVNALERENQALKNPK